jgi:DNA-binding CsgD family transcriptional regulator/archaellum biogenesis ATPase FlaH
LTAYRRRRLCTAVTTAKEAIEKGEIPDIVESDLNKALEADNSRGGTDKGILFSDLMKKVFPTETWLVDSLITAGLTVITGASKIGKSWLCLQLTTALDQGGYFLGTLQTSKSDCLYCALEDTQKRIQKRIEKQGIPAFNGSRLETVRRNTAELRAFLKSNPQYRVVIIDTLQKFLGIRDMNDYSQTVDGLSALKAIADDLNRALIVIHHNRKGADLDGDHMESALGSTGINATADCTLTMTRKRGTSEAALKATGRDIVDTSFTLSWDADICSWSVTGQGALRPTLTEAQQQIIDLLESEARNWTTKEIADGLGKTRPAVSNLLKKLMETGHVENLIYGQWRAKRSFTVSSSLRGGETVKLRQGTIEGGKAPSFPETNPVEATEGELEIW